MHKPLLACKQSVEIAYGEVVRTEHGRVFQAFQPLWVGNENISVRSLQFL